MKPTRSRYRGHRYPLAIISHAVWLYHRFGLSRRDVEDLLAIRGIVVSDLTIRHGGQRMPDHHSRLCAGPVQQYRRGNGDSTGTIKKTLDLALRQTICKANGPVSHLCYTVYTDRRYVRHP